MKREKTEGTYKVSPDLKSVVSLCSDRTLALRSLTRRELSNLSLDKGSFCSGNLAQMLTNVAVLLYVSTAQTTKWQRKVEGPTFFKLFARIIFKMLALSAK